MADAIVSLVLEQLASVIGEKIIINIKLVNHVPFKLKIIKEKLDTIKNFLHEADNKRFSNQNINTMLLKLEKMSYEMEDILDEWNYNILTSKIQGKDSANKNKVTTSNSYFDNLVIRRDISQKIVIVNAQLDDILNEKTQFNFGESQHTNNLPLPQWRKVQTTSLINFEDVRGRDSDKDKLVSKIIWKEDGIDSNLGGFRVVSIVGVGGIGKTTLAQLVYNDVRVKNCFDLSIWICVSDPFDENQIAKEIIGQSNIDAKQLDTLLKQVIERISDKKFLLVLDDVWNEDLRKWEPLKNSLMSGKKTGSIVMVTTRNEIVARMMGTRDIDIYHPEHLSHDDCYTVLCRTATISGRKGVNVDAFENIGRKIAKKCQGLPLAAKILGGLLRNKNKVDEWDNILKNEIWQLDDIKCTLFPHLLLSYNELSAPHKRCFSYCAVYPKDYRIDVRKLIDCWMVLGYLGSPSSDQDLEIKCGECFDILLMHSLLIQYRIKDRESCKMHDIIHDFAQYLRNNGSVKGEALMQRPKNCKSCQNSNLWSHVKEYRTLFWEKKAAPPVICNCLKTLRVLQINDSKLQTIPQEMGKLIHLRWLDLSHNDLHDANLKTIFNLYNLQTVDFSWSKLREIPTEIGNLIHLRILRLHGNSDLTALPSSICSLVQLRLLNIKMCNRNFRLPNEIDRLTNLKYLYNRCIYSMPEGLAKLTGLREMTDIYGGSDYKNLGLLKNLNNLSGRFYLHINLKDENLGSVVEGARNAKMSEKKNIKDLKIIFEDNIVKVGSAAMRMDVINALKPQPNLQKLTIRGYKCSKLEPPWLQTLNQLRYISLSNMDCIISSLPPLWKLSSLEQIEISTMTGLTFVERQFIGGDDMNIAFPKLKTLSFINCPKWTVWEDIIEKKEEKAATMSLMPCLIELSIISCPELIALPHRLLHKARSFRNLRIYGSLKLGQLYKDKKTSPLKSLSELNVQMLDKQ